VRSLFRALVDLLSGSLLTGEDGTNRGQQKIQMLKTNSNYFRQKLIDMGLDIIGDWDSPVIVSLHLW